jgi:hypothetical protein
MRKSLRFLIPAVAALTIGRADAQSLVGITDANQLFTMASVATPGTVSTPMAMTGLASGQTVAGLDYRPATGDLYALGYNSSNGESQLYRANITTGALTVINTTPVVLALGTGPVGFDFNPTVDRIRVVGANRKNYRLNPDNGAIAATDLDLNYPITDVNGLNQASVVAVAYTNSYPGLTTTALYDYDQNLNVLSLQNPPNNGTLNTIGASGITASTTAQNVDMDIQYNPSTRINTTYLTARIGAGSNALYAINPATGGATLIGSIGLNVKNIAIQPYAIPAPGALSGQLVYALISGTRTMISFDSQNPRQLRSLVNVTGVDTAMTIAGMDFRPSNGMLYALGYQPGVSPRYQLYTINTISGAATAVNAGTKDTIGLGNTANLGFDFNPTVDLIRIVSTLGANYRMSPATGLVTMKDSNLAWAMGDANTTRQVRISSVGYTNSYPGATSTTLYGINDSGAVYVTINPPNNGRVNTIMSNLYALNTADGTTDIDFFYDSTSMSNIGYLAANSGAGTMDVLYRIVPATGVLTAMDTIAYGVAISDIAVMPMFRNASASVAGPGKYEPSPLVYPNPTAQLINIVLPKSVMNGNYSISDLSGRSVQRGELNSTTSKLSIESLAPGVYILQVQADAKSYAPVRISKM